MAKIVNWRSVHYHNKDKWTGVVTEEMWKWKSQHIKSPNGKVFMTDETLRGPSDAKDQINKIMNYPKPKIVEPIIKHANTETINFLVLARELHAISPFNIRDFHRVLKSLKINIVLAYEITVILDNLGLISEEIKRYKNDREWFGSVKSPQELFEKEI